MHVTKITELKELIGEENFRINLIDIDEVSTNYGTQYTLTLTVAVDGALTTVTVNKPNNSSWKNEELEIGKTYSVAILYNHEYNVNQLILLGEHVDNSGEVEVGKTPSKATVTNIKDLPKEFTAEVVVANHNVKTKSMYLTMLPSRESYRVTIPKTIDASEIDGRVCNFKVRGVSLLILENILHYSDLVDNTYDFTDTTPAEMHTDEPEELEDHEAGNESSEEIEVREGQVWASHNGILYHVDAVNNTNVMYSSGFKQKLSIDEFTSKFSLIKLEVGIEFRNGLVIDAMDSMFGETYFRLTDGTSTIEPAVTAKDITELYDLPESNSVEAQAYRLLNHMASLSVTSGSEEILTMTDQALTMASTLADSVVQNCNG